MQKEKKTREGEKKRVCFISRDNYSPTSLSDLVYKITSKFISFVYLNIIYILYI